MGVYQTGDVLLLHPVLGVARRLCTAGTRWRVAGRWYPGVRCAPPARSCSREVYTCWQSRRNWDSEMSLQIGGLSFIAALVLFAITLWQQAQPE